MTCKELRWYFEDHLRDAEVRCARGAVAEHAATCPECSRFVAEQRELGRSLREIRESVGPVPQSVDTSVLLNYRRHIADLGARRRVTTNSKFHPRLVWGVAAVAAALLVIAGSVMRSRHSTAGNARHTTATQTGTISVREAPKNAASGFRHPASGLRDVRPANPKLTTARRVRPSAPERTASLPVRTVRSLPEGFRSLMYCDELSCPQDMEMIRVQLPSSAMPRQVSSFIQTSGSVTADVLVGPDGIARGIRLEEIEF
jgi:hypothetical protein